MVELVVIPSGRSLHTFRRGYSDFWTFQTLPSVLGCARNGVRANPSTMVNSALSFEGFISNIWIVWFRRYRKENFHDESLPLGKWSRRESKQNWVWYMPVFARRTNFPTQRISYIQLIPARESAGSGYTTSNTHSGYQSPREMKEEQWRTEALAVSRPSKGDMREMYKELGGRKSKSKAKVGGTGRFRDKGGLGGHEEW